MPIKTLILNETFTFKYHSIVIHIWRGFRVNIMVIVSSLAVKSEEKLKVWR